MFQIPELAAGMGFGPDYQFDLGTKREQGERIGNAVCPQLAAALVGANYRPEPVSAASPLRLVREAA